MHQTEELERNALIKQGKLDQVRETKAMVLRVGYQYYSIVNGCAYPLKVTSIYHSKYVEVESEDQWGNTYKGTYAPMVTIFVVKDKQRMTVHEKLINQAQQRIDELNSQAEDYGELRMVQFFEEDVKLFRDVLELAPQGLLYHLPQPWKALADALRNRNFENERLKWRIAELEKENKALQHLNAELQENLDYIDAMFPLVEESE